MWSGRQLHEYFSEGRRKVDAADIWQPSAKLCGVSPGDHDIVDVF